MRDEAASGSAELLEKIKRGMAITADLSRSDLLLVVPRNPSQVAVLAQAQPHSIASLYPSSLVGQTLTDRDAPAILEAWRNRRRLHTQRELIRSGAPVDQEIYPIYGPDREMIALLSIETSLIQLERHRQRHVSFRHVVEWVKRMCMRGDLAGAAGFSPFSEWDGIVLTDAQRRIMYLSGIATNLYRRLGYMEDLRGRRLSFLDTGDDELAAEALALRTPIEREARLKENAFLLVRKVLPLWSPPVFAGRLQRLLMRQSRLSEASAALILIHDATEEQRKRIELEVKTTLIQEVHHRVKNNLQAIAGMLRMQARRTRDDEALRVLQEATTRILSVALIHEFLSLDGAQAINLRDVCQRIISQNIQVLVRPEAQVIFSVKGPDILLPSQQATACALVVNELAQNALEHGIADRERGEVQLRLVEFGQMVRLEVWDDGAPLPETFDLSAPRTLGLQIVRTLVESDLRGNLRLENQEVGVLATVEFPKQPAE